MQNHTGELTRRLDGLGVAQYVITTRPPGAPRVQQIGQRSRVIRLGWRIRRFRQGYSVPALPRALSVAGSVDIVHAHLGEDLAVLPLAMLAALRAHLPLVVTIHCDLRHTLQIVDARSALLKALGGWIQGKAQSRADAVIVITERARRLLSADGLSTDKVHLIPPGVNRALFNGPLSDPFPHIERPRAVFVGRLSRQKGVAVLMESLRLLRVRAQFVLVGDGPERASVEKTIRDHRLDNCHVIGFLPHDRIPNVLAHADVLVLPSIYEEFGSVLIEAMQAGLPVVASRTGGIPEVITHGENGLLVPPGDPRELAGAITTLLSDTAMRARFREVALERSNRYDWGSVAKEVLNLYMGLLPPDTKVDPDGVPSS